MLYETTSIAEVVSMYGDLRYVCTYLLYHEFVLLS